MTLDCAQLIGILEGYPAGMKVLLKLPAPDLTATDIKTISVEEMYLDAKETSKDPALYCGGAGEKVLILEF